MKFRKILFYGLLCGAYLFHLGGCSSTRKAPLSNVTPSGIMENSSKPENKEIMGPPEPYGPDSPPPASAYGPSPVQVRPIVLVLGPGLAKGFSYIGVLKALHNAKIPIGAILGTEMGGFIGALYSESGNINQFEWRLLKFKESVFIKSSGFMKRAGEISNGELFKEQLNQAFGNKDLKDLKIPILLGIQDQITKKVTIMDHGRVTDLVRAAMASPEIFTPTRIQANGQTLEAVSSRHSRPFLVNEARLMGLGPVVVFNALTESESAIAQDELKGADLVINLELNSISEKDFSKKTNAIFLGKRALERHLSEIKKLAGFQDFDADVKGMNSP